MNHMNIAEASQKWHISERPIRLLCSEGRIEGGVKSGRSWFIPVHAAKPTDARVRSHHVYQGLDYDFSSIDDMKRRIDQKRPFPSRLAASLREKIIIEWTYNSNAIEGNTLTLSETRVVLEGITVGGKSIVEHLEALNHRLAS